jgi:hypothetical protein
MPQKKVKKAPFVLLSILVLVAVVSVVSIWSVFGHAMRSLTDAADISLSQIEYITLRYQGENGASQVKKITEAGEIESIYSLLSSTKVSKRVSFGLDQKSDHNSISVKLKSGEVVAISSSNRFEGQNRGPLSAFFVCYYDVVSPAEFEETVSHYAA